MRTRKQIEDAWDESDQKARMSTMFILELLLDLRDLLTPPKA
jgi:hypothetical protein